MARIELISRYYGDGDGRRAVIEATIKQMKPLAASSGTSTGDPVAQRVRASVTEADVARVSGIDWTDVVVTDGARTVGGKVSKLELLDGGELEFLLTPGL